MKTTRTTLRDLDAATVRELSPAEMVHVTGGGSSDNWCWTDTSTNNGTSSDSDGSGFHVDGSAGGGGYRFA